jgi:hypothetical protein
MQAVRLVSVLIGVALFVAVLFNGAYWLLSRLTEQLPH